MSVVTADNIRAAISPGTVIKAGKHEGGLKRRTENYLSKLDNFTPVRKKSIEDFFREKRERELAEKKARIDAEMKAQQQPDQTNNERGS